MSSTQSGPYAKYDRLYLWIFAAKDSTHTPTQAYLTDTVNDIVTGWVDWMDHNGLAWRNNFSSVCAVKASGLDWPHDSIAQHEISHNFNATDRGRWKYQHPECLVVVLLPRMYPYTAVLDIDRLDYEPEHYFELTEEDLDKYPVLREALEEMKRQGKDTIFYKVPKDEDYAIFNYLSQKQREVGPTDTYYYYIACFKYEGVFYGFNLMT